MIVYRQLAVIPVEMFYAPERERCVILQRGEAVVSFEDIESAVRYARGMGWLNEAQAHEARETAQKTIFSYDRRQCTLDDKSCLSMNKRRVIKSASYSLIILVNPVFHGFLSLFHSRFGFLFRLLIFLTPRLGVPSCTILYSTGGAISKA